jgi:transposase
VDIILGKERRRWSREEKLAIVAETFAPGVVILDVARRHQVSSGQVHTWRKQFRAELGFPAPPPPTPPRLDPPAAPAMRFMPLAIAAERAPAMIEVELAGGARLKITGGLDADLVAALVKALSRR